MVVYLLVYAMITIYFVFHFVFAPFLTSLHLRNPLQTVREHIQLDMDWARR